MSGQGLIFLMYLIVFSCLGPCGTRACWAGGDAVLALQPGKGQVMGQRLGQLDRSGGSSRLRSCFTSGAGIALKRL